MQVIQNNQPVAGDVRGAAFALGNFDGLHRGHEAVIDAARAAADRLCAPLGLACFEPAPRRYFQADAAPFRIMNAAWRREVLADVGVDVVVELPFDQAMATMSDRGFCERVLVERLGAKAVAVGYDFCFGKGRTGNARTLSKDAANLGFEAIIVDKVADAEGADKISSSAIRDHIRAGRVEDAGRMLGRPWRIDATVEDGAKRGRTIGFPTANLRLGDTINPAHGVYAVRARIAGEGPWRPGVANFGRTPTVGEREPLLEVNLFDFSGDLYGEALSVQFAGFLRAERKFDGLDALKAQIAMDADAARRMLG